METKKFYGPLDLGVQIQLADNGLFVRVEAFSPPSPPQGRLCSNIEDLKGFLVSVVDSWYSEEEDEGQ